MCKLLFKTLVIAAAAGFAACSSDEPKNGPDNPGKPENPGSPGTTSLFVINEGGFMKSNGSLSLYDPAKGSVANDVFRAANGFGPGDVVQSMTIAAESPYAWLVVNNSQVVFAIDPSTCQERGRISGDITSPRQILFVNDSKAYISQFYTDRIAVVNPKTYTVTGGIEYPIAEGSSASTGEMVRVGDYVYVCCPNYNSALLKVDTRTDKVTDVCYPGIQPAHIVVDANKDLWVLCDGSYEGSPYGYEAPKLVRIDSSDLTIKADYSMNLGDYVSVLAIDNAGRTLYWINGGVYSMDIAAGALPSAPLIAADGSFYGLTISPDDKEIYVADAIDYSQPGRVLRYSARGGEAISTFTVGVCPHAFCWK